MFKKYSKFIILSLFAFPMINTNAQVNDSLTIGYSYINSIPQNSQVFFNDSLLGYTPLYFIFNKSVNPDAGFVIRQKGYMDFTFRSVEDEKINKTVSLIPQKKGLVIPNPVHENENEYFARPRKVVPIVISSILTAGAGILSYYFKKLANDNSDTFDITGDQSSLDRKKRYDLISGISLGAFQVSFAGLLYFLFIDK